MTEDGENFEGYWNFDEYWAQFCKDSSTLDYTMRDIARLKYTNYPLNMVMSVTLRESGRSVIAELRKAAE